MDAALRDVLIVLPAFNEQEPLGATLDELERVVPGVQRLVVNDGSSDATAEVARQHGVAVATLPFNLGVGAAMRFGFRYAVERGFKAVVQFDADGQHNPEYIPQLVAGLNSADIVIGARFAGVGEYSTSGPRKWAMQLLSSVISRTAKTTLTDTTSGFKANGPRALSLFAKDYPAEYLGDTIESLVVGLRSGLTASQVPVAMRARAGGQPSQNAWRSTVFLLRAFVALTFAYVRPRSQVEAKG